MKLALFYFNLFDSHFFIIHPHEHLPAHTDHILVLCTKSRWHAAPTTSMIHSLLAGYWYTSFEYFSTDNR